jgi:hypothetical protein
MSISRNSTHHPRAQVSPTARPRRVGLSGTARPVSGQSQGRTVHLFSIKDGQPCAEVWATADGKAAANSIGSIVSIVTEAPASPPRPHKRNGDPSFSKSREGGLPHSRGHAPKIKKLGSHTFLGPIPATGVTIPAGGKPCRKCGGKDFWISANGTKRNCRRCARKLYTRYYHRHRQTISNRRVKRRRRNANRLVAQLAFSVAAGRILANSNHTHG